MHKTKRQRRPQNTLDLGAWAVFRVCDRTKYRFSVLPRIQDTIPSTHNFVRGQTRGYDRHQVFAGACPPLLSGNLPSNTHKKSTSLPRQLASLANVFDFGRSQFWASKKDINVCLHGRNSFYCTWSGSYLHDIEDGIPDC